MFCVTGKHFGEEKTDDSLRAASILLGLPIADTFFLLSRGQLSGGTVRVLTSPDQASDMAAVKFTVRYMRNETRDLVKICGTSRGEDARGIGAFVSRSITAVVIASTKE
jgi:hypothetical protein